ncbi:EMC3/TMCO1 family protein [[Eubacterium] cellulosolvens]
MSFVETFMEFMRGLLSPYSEIPSSTFLIITIAASLSIITTLANRFLVDVKKMKSIMRDVNAFRQEFNEARKSGDKKRIDKAMKKQKAVMKLQSTMMMDRMKVSFIFLLPFWIIFMVLNSFFGAKTVAYTPFTIPFLLARPEMAFYSWYILCSFGISLPLTRLFGVNPED